MARLKGHQCEQQPQALRKANQDKTDSYCLDRQYVLPHAGFTDHVSTEPSASLRRWSVGHDWPPRELAVLSALAALGCGLAAVQGDLLFVAIFSVASAVTIIEAIRRLQ